MILLNAVVAFGLVLATIRFYNYVAQAYRWGPRTYAVFFNGVLQTEGPKEDYVWDPLWYPLRMVRQVRKRDVLTIITLPYGDVEVHVADDEGDFPRKP